MTTGKHAKRTERDFRSPICRFVIGQDLRAPSSADDPVLLLSQGKRYCCQYNLVPISHDLSSLTLAQENEYERTLGTTLLSVLTLDDTAECLYLHRDDFPKQYGQNHGPRMQKVHFRLMCVARCLSSLLPEEG